MVVVQVIGVAAAADDFQGYGLPGNGEGDAHGGVAGGAFHFVAREGVVRDSAIGGHGFGADTGRIVGKAGGVAVVAHTDQFIFHVEGVGVVINRIAESHKTTALGKLLTARPKPTENRLVTGKHMWRGAEHRPH